MLFNTGRLIFYKNVCILPLMSLDLKNEVIIKPDFHLIRKEERNDFPSKIVESNTPPEYSQFSHTILL